MCACVCVCVRVVCVCACVRACVCVSKSHPSQFLRNELKAVFTRETQTQLKLQLTIPWLLSLFALCRMYSNRTVRSCFLASLDELNPEPSSLLFRQWRIQVHSYFMSLLSFVYANRNSIRWFVCLSVRPAVPRKPGCCFFHDVTSNFWLYHYLAPASFSSVNSSFFWKHAIWLSIFPFVFREAFKDMLCSRFRKTETKKVYVKAPRQVQ